jgi:hypothetical protein
MNARARVASKGIIGVREGGTIAISLNMLNEAVGFL